MSRHHTFIAALTLFSFVCAPKTEAQPLAAGYSEQTASRTLSQKEFAENAAGNIGFLPLMRDWRDTLRGNGNAPRRDLLTAKIWGHDAKIALGAVAPPSISGLEGAGISTSVGTWEIGTTARPDALNGILRGFDRAMTGERIADADGQSANWLRARPISNASAELEISLARAARDVQMGEGENWENGEFKSVSGRLQLPARWKASAALLRAQMDDADAKIEWKTRLEGPVSHPLGEARAVAQWSATDAGFANFASQNEAGARVGSVEATQDLKIGALSGIFNARGEKIARDDVQNAPVGEAMEKKSALTGAQLKLGIFGGLALQAQGQWQIAHSEKVGETANFDEETQTHGGEIGVSWQLSRATKLGASIGKTQTFNACKIGENWQNSADFEENRAALELRHQSGGGLLAASFSAREHENQASNDQNWRRPAVFGIEAERQLLGSFRLRARADCGRDRDPIWSDQNGLARRFETGLIFSRASRLDLRWRDGAVLPAQWTGDVLGAPFGYLFPVSVKE